MAKKKKKKEVQDLLREFCHLPYILHNAMMWKHETYQGKPVMVKYCDVLNIDSENSQAILLHSNLCLKTLRFIRKRGLSQGKIIIISYRNLSIENISQ